MILEDLILAIASFHAKEGEKDWAILGQAKDLDRES